MGQPDDYPQRPVVESTYVKGGAGHACTVKADQTIALSLPNGPQVVDLDVFDAHDPQEHFGSSITRIAFGSHLDVGDDLLSCPPEGRPMLRVVKNTVVDDDGHETSDARAWTHDLLFGRCSRTQRRRRYNSDTPGCQEIITAAISPWALTQYDVHDPLNVFMTTGLDARGKLFHVPSRARAGDEFALRAHRDCLVAMSACPGASSGGKAHGVQVTVFEARTAA